VTVKGDVMAPLLDELQDLKRMAQLGGWIFRDATFFAARVELDAARMGRLLPFGLSLAEPATATLFVAHYPETSFGSVYSESGLFVDVRHLFRPAVHCPWMLVDDDVALILGREMLGYPKKLGSFELHIGADEVSARVERRGHEVLRMRGRLGEPAGASAPPILGQPVRNVWGAVGVGLQKILSFTPREEMLEARRVHDVELVIGQAPRDPLAQLGIGRVLEAHLCRVNIGGDVPPVPLGWVSPLYFLRTWRLRFH
jgi:acetoacetate decarboxylase